MTAEVIESCAVWTTRPYSEVGELHNRISAIVPSEPYTLRLDPKVESPGQIVPLMEPCPDKDTEIGPVCREVNNSANECPAVIEPPE